MNLTILCETETEIRQAGNDLARVLRKGDLVTLSGELGIGKTALVRAIVRALADDESLDVPSPTFTLVQHYEDVCDPPIAHMDLYRLTDPPELRELGLEEALEKGAVLVEWPQKGAIEERSAEFAIGIEPGEKAKSAKGAKNAQGEEKRENENEPRIVRVIAKPERSARLKRSFEIRDFLAQAGAGRAKRAALAGDASGRNYEIIKPAKGERVIGARKGELVLMDDAPPCGENGKIDDYRVTTRLADKIDAFIAIARLLAQNGFAAPEIYACDYERGLALMEYLGSAGIADAGAPIVNRYEAALDVMVSMHEAQWPDCVKLENNVSHKIEDYDERALMGEIGLLPRYYAPHKLGRKLTETEQTDFDDIWRALLSNLRGENAAETSLALRDYHSPNVIWREEKKGNDRIGLIDFQDALIGPTAYDIASIVQDARLDIEEDVQNHLADYYCRKRRARKSEFDEEKFRGHLALMQAQRACKVLGIFVRLKERDAKPDYMGHLPRIELYLRQSLRHETLAPLRGWVNRVLGEKS